MEQIERGVYIESGFKGVTLGALALSLGTILIDAPPCPADARSWRAALRNLGSGVNRVMINLDDHYDRTLGARQMECAVMAQIKTAQSFEKRSAVFKGQLLESGEDWEACIGLSGIRWSPPNLTFTKSACLHWDDQPILLEHHPGPAPGATWLILQEIKAIFVGDAVVLNQPPFLANAYIPDWVETLDLLLSTKYRDYLIISSRGGPVSIETIRAQRRSLKYILRRLIAFSEREAPPETTEAIIPKLLSNIEFPQDRQEQYTQRLSYGLYHYYLRHYWPDDESEDE